MGVYADYLNLQLNFASLTIERQAQLARISAIRGRDVLVYAADLSKGNAQISIEYADILPIREQLDNLSGTKLDLILETPGGSGEAAEDIIRMLRGRYEEVAVIVPGWAKSAGTLMAMAADDILMGNTSALGPIDAQMSRQGKVFSADALLEGMDKIKREVEQTGILNKAYIPILQGISPGEIQAAENAMKFAKVLVRDWLAGYKFRTWEKHSSTGNVVTNEERRARADEVAHQLGDHRRWLTHGRSLRIQDLEGMRLIITNYDTQPDLADAIKRYHTLLQMTFATNVYKVFETPTSQIFRFNVPQVPIPADPSLQDIVVKADCGNCKASSLVQVDLEHPKPLKAGHLPFPKDNIFKCPNCGAPQDLTGLRQQIEAQTKKTVAV